LHKIYNLAIYFYINLCIRKVIYIKPVILLTSNFQDEIYSLNRRYCDIVQKCGAVPVISPIMSVKDIPYIVKGVSAVILTGGGDVSPHIAGVEHAVFSQNCSIKRDISEIALCRHCFENKILLMGICRGMQIMCIAAGGSICEDISLFSGKTHNHVQSIDKKLPSHKVYVKRKSFLYNILKKDSIYVNSLHHQCVDKSGFLRISAVASDGVPEAVEDREKGIFLGFQWHPEQCLAGGYSELIFRYFIDKCK